jgi:hypothetical protein
MTVETTIESGDYELIAKGREPRFYADGHQAGAAFYAADRADMPRVVRHETMVETIKGERLETPQVTQVAMTTPAPDKPALFEHVMLEAPPEFRAGYDEARQRLPAKAIDATDLLAAGPQQPQETVMDKDQDKARLQINGIEVGRIDFGKESTPSGVRAHFTALRAGREDEVIGAFVDVAKGDLEKILGQTVGGKLATFQGRVGTLSGMDLDVPASEAQRGVAPEKSAPEVATAKPQNTPTTQHRLEIEGQPVERLSYVKRQSEQGLRYEVTAYGSGDKVLAKHPALAKEELAAHVGETAAKHLQATRGRNGSLRGDALAMPANDVQPARPQATQDQHATKPQAAVEKAQPAPLQFNGQDIARMSFGKEITAEGQRYHVAAYGADGKLLDGQRGLTSTDLGLRYTEKAAEQIRQALLSAPRAELSQAELAAPLKQGLDDPRKLVESIREAGPVQPVVEMTVARESRAPDAAIIVRLWDEKAMVTQGRFAPEALRGVVGDDLYKQMTQPAVPVATMESYRGMTIGDSGDKTPQGLAGAASLKQWVNQELDAMLGRSPMREPRPEVATPTAKPEPVVNSIEELLAKAGVVPQEPHQLPPRLQKIIDGVARDQAERTAGSQAPHPDAGIKIGPYTLPEAPVDPAERRRQELLASLAERFTINAGEYRTRHEQSQVAFVDRDTAVTTARNEPEIARAMVDLAEAKGWKGLHLKGTEPFKAAAWMEASVRGLPSHGYEPTRADRERLAIKVRERDAALQTNRIEPLAQQKGAAREQAAPAQQRAAALDPQAAKAREQALGALEVYLKSQNVPKDRMEVLMKQGGETLDKLAAQGKVPEVRVFDAQAQRAHSIHIQPAQQVATPQRSR